MMRRTLEGFEFSDHSMKVMMFIATLVGAIFTAGVSFASARVALASKAEVSDVIHIQSQLYIDSLREDAHMRELRNVENKIDSLSVRVSQLACYRSAIPACR